MVKKGTRGFHFPRGLRTHRYSCVALRALMKSQPSKLSQPSKHYFPRGLHTPRYSCVALRALMKSQPSKPSQPSKLSKPSKPSQPSKPSKPSKPSQPSKPYFPRGLRHHSYHCVAEVRI